MAYPENPLARDEILKSLIGRDLEQRESGDSFRGPIIRIGIKIYPDKKQWVEFYLGWLAINQGQGWQLLWEPKNEEEAEKGTCITGISADWLSMHRDLSGAVHISVPYIGTVTICRARDNLAKSECEAQP